MGENFFFVSLVAICASPAIGLKGAEAWQTALAAVFISGIIFLIITLLRIRKMIMNIISPSLQYAIAGGIGMFIALLGFRNSGLIVASEAGLFMTNNFHSKILLIFAIGFLATASMQALRVRGSILWGILIGAAVALVTGQIHFPTSPVLSLIHI